MGEFSYAEQSDFQADYGFGAGFETDPDAALAGYQQELQALIPKHIPMLAAVLKEMGVLQPEALEAALAKQAETGDSLAQVLLDGGWAAPDQLVQALQTRAIYK